MALTPAIVDVAEVDYFRVGVFYTAADDLFDNVEKTFDVCSFDATRRALTLGSRDATTGHRAITWTETTVTIIVNPATLGAWRMTPAGILSTFGAESYCLDPIETGDQILVEELYFEVKDVQKPMVGDSYLPFKITVEHLPNVVPTWRY